MFDRRSDNLEAILWLVGGLCVLVFAGRGWAAIPGAGAHQWTVRTGQPVSALVDREDHVLAHPPLPPRSDLARKIEREWRQVRRQISEHWRQMRSRYRAIARRNAGFLYVMVHGEPMPLGDDLKVWLAKSRRVRSRGVWRAFDREESRLVLALPDQAWESSPKRRRGQGPRLASVSQDASTSATPFSGGAAVRAHKRTQHEDGPSVTLAGKLATVGTGGSTLAWSDKTKHHASMAIDPTVTSSMDGVTTSRLARVGTSIDEVHNASESVSLSTQQLTTAMAPPEAFDVSPAQRTVQASAGFASLKANGDPAPILSGTTSIVPEAPKRITSHGPMQKLARAAPLTPAQGGDIPEVLSQRLSELKELGRRSPEAALSLAGSLYEQWDQPRQSERIFDVVLGIARDTAGNAGFEAVMATVRRFAQQVQAERLQHRIRLRMGRLYYAQGSYGKAVAELPVDTSRKKPDRYQTRAGLVKGISWIRLGKAKRALKMLGWVASQGTPASQQSHAALLLGKLYRVYDKPGEAQRWLRHARDQAQQAKRRNEAQKLLKQLGQGDSNG